MRHKSFTVKGNRCRALKAVAFAAAVSGSIIVVRIAARSRRCANRWSLVRYRVPTVWRYRLC